MNSNLIHDRGRGPEVVGTRITVYNLLPDLLDHEMTEAMICRAYSLTPNQVAAARAYVLQNPDTVLAQHLKIEERTAIGNPPEVREAAQKSKELFAKFKTWADEQNRLDAEHAERNAQDGPTVRREFQTFREWLKEQEAAAVTGR